MKTKLITTPMGDLVLERIKKAKLDGKAPNKVELNSQEDCEKLIQEAIRRGLVKRVSIQ